MKIFFNTNEEQKEYVKRKLALSYPEFKTGGDFYRQFIRQEIKENSIVLDAGCGSGGIIGEFRNIPAKIIGVDINSELLSKNEIVQEKILADLANIPLPDNSIDAVVSEFVIEHLLAPEKVFQELYRVLKPGGSLIFLTPNLLNPVMMASKLLPHEIHQFWLSNLLKKQTVAHQTYYRCNTVRRLKFVGRQVGFSQLEIAQAGNPEYLGFCRPLVHLAIYIEKLMSFFPFNQGQMYLIGRWVK